MIVLFLIHALCVASAAHVTVGHVTRTIEDRGNVNKAWLMIIINLSDAATHIHTYTQLQLGYT